MDSAKEYEDQLDKAEVVERDRVDEALTEKLDLARKFVQERKGEVCPGLPSSVLRVQFPCVHYTLSYISSRDYWAVEVKVGF